MWSADVCPWDAVVMGGGGRGRGRGGVFVVVLLPAAAATAATGEGVWFLEKLVVELVETTV